MEGHQINDNGMNPQNGTRTNDLMFVEFEVRSTQGRKGSLQLPRQAFLPRLVLNARRPGQNLH